MRLKKTMRYPVATYINIDDRPQYICFNMRKTLVHPGCEVELTLRDIQHAGSALRFFESKVKATAVADQKMAALKPEPAVTILVKEPEPVIEIKKSEPVKIEEVEKKVVEEIVPEVVPAIVPEIEVKKVEVDSETKVELKVDVTPEVKVRTKVKKEKFSSTNQQ